MNCPECGQVMEGEEIALVSSIDHEGVRHTPSGHFYCHNCDSEWVWYKKEPPRKIDGADRTSRMPCCGEARPWWTVEEEEPCPYCGAC